MQGQASSLATFQPPSSARAQHARVSAWGGDHGRLFPGVADSAVLPYELVGADDAGSLGVKKQLTQEVWVRLPPDTLVSAH